MTEAELKSEDLQLFAWPYPDHKDAVYVPYVQ
jgi:hypothetical protein